MRRADDAAHGGGELACRGAGVEVAVAYRGDGDHGPENSEEMRMRDEKSETELRQPPKREEKSLKSKARGSLG